MRLYDEAIAIAVQHVQHERKRGVNIRSVMASIGKKPVDSWDECTEAFAFMWLTLSCSGATGRATTAASPIGRSKKTQPMQAVL